MTLKVEVTRTNGERYVRLFLKTNAPSVMINVHSVFFLDVFLICGGVKIPKSYHDTCGGVGVGEDDETRSFGTLESSCLAERRTSRCKTSDRKFRMSVGVTTE